MVKYLALLSLLLLSGLTHAQAPTPVEPPRCSPLDYPGNFQLSTASDGSIVALLWCDTDRLLTWTGYAWNPNQNPVGTCVKLKSTQSLATVVMSFFANCFKASGSQMTTAQQASFAILFTKWMPHLAVDGTGGSKDHTVWDYSSCPTTLNCHPIQLGSLRIASGRTCSAPGYVAETQGEPNEYYNVGGQVATNGAPIPAGAYYTPCVMVAPPATGW